MSTSSCGLVLRLHLVPLPRFCHGIDRPSKASNVTQGPARLIAGYRSKAYGLFDVKALFISHVTIFEAGSALCGAAPTMNALIVGRAIA